MNNCDLLPPFPNLVEHMNICTFVISCNINSCITAGVAQSVRAFASQAQGWVFES